MSAANGRSFFYGTDAEMDNGSASFVAKILAEPEAYGLVEADAQGYQEIQQLYAAAYFAAVSPETRTKSRVTAKNEAKENLRLASARLASVINGKAFVTDAQKIALGLNVRKAPSPAQRPETPYGFTIELGTIGEIRLRWKNRKATGCVYDIQRQINGTGDPVMIGRTGKKRFVDQTVPAGTSKIQYRVQAVRSTGASDWGIINVFIGGVVMLGAAPQPSGMNLAA